MFRRWGPQSHILITQGGAKEDPEYASKKRPLLGPRILAAQKVGEREPRVFAERRAASRRGAQGPEFFQKPKPSARKELRLPRKNVGGKATWVAIAQQEM